MTTSKRSRAAALGFAAMIGCCGGAASETSFCGGIKDPAARTACLKGLPIPQGAIPDQAGPAARDEYANKLRRRFLSSGIDMSVISFEQRPTNQRGRARIEKYPRLHLFGYLSNPLIFQLITEGGMLSSAQKAGFQVIEFQGKGSTGARWFDLSTGRLPECDVDRNVCR